MFCDKCGKENPDNVQFCAGCGATLNAPAATPANGVKFPVAKILKIAVPVVIAVLAILLVVNLFGGSAHEKLIENYLEAESNNDGKLYKKCVGDPYYIEWLTSKDGKNIKDDNVDAYFRRYVGGYTYDYKTNYDISIDHVTKFEKKEVEDIAEWLNEHTIGEGEYAEKVEYGYDEDDVKDVVIVEYKLERVSDKYGSQKYVSSYDEAVLIKVKGKWYVSELLSRGIIDGILD